MSTIQVPSGRHVRSLMEDRERYEKIDGMILGPSQAEVGIVPERLSEGCFVNLALSSQDIYYNYATLRYCAAEHMEQISRMSALIIDMMDYCYFNYDVSLSREIRNYIRFGGIEDPHNYYANKNYNKPWEELVMEAHNDHPKPQNRSRIVKDSDLEQFPNSNALRTKRFETTIEENTMTFHRLLKLARDINPNMRIICLFLPRFYKTRERFSEVFARWNSEYMEILRESQKQYGFEFLDYTDHAITMRRDLYFDAPHLNVTGAKLFTNLLRSDLESMYGGDIVSKE